MTKTWTTREGDVINVMDMTDSHIRNTLRYFRTRCEAIRLGECLEACAFARAMRFSEGAQDAFDAEMVDLAEADDDEVLCRLISGFEAVLEEAQRRKLE